MISKIFFSVVLLLCATLRMSVFAQNVDAQSQQLPLVPLQKGAFNIQFQDTTPKAPPNDLYMGYDPKIDLHGFFVYAPLLFADPASQEYFVIRELNGLQDKTEIMSYHVKTADFLFDPQFSSDGKLLYFKIGWPFDFPGKYDLYQWNFADQSVKSVLSNMNNRNIYPSPDNQWVAYINGGEEENGAYSATLRYLAVVNLKTGNEIKLKNDTAPDGVAWTSQKTLLFTMPPPGGQTTAPSIKGEPGKYDWTKQLRPAVHEASPVKQVSWKLIDSASNPVPSPDGNKIVYFGWSDKMERVSKSVMEAESKGDKPPHQVLALFDRKTQHSKLLQDTLPDSVLWSPDGKLVIVVNVSSNSATDENIHYEATISKINLVTLTSKKLAVLHATDITGVTRSKYTPNFSSMQVTNDGHFLLMRVSNYTGSDNPFFKETAILEAVDLDTGKVSEVASIKDPGSRIMGWDWHDLSRPLK